MGILRKVRKAEEILLVTSMLAILFFIFSQAFLRYLLGSGITWGEEFARYVFIAQIWMGASLAVKTNEHIKITFLRDLFDTKGRKVFDLASTFLFFIFMFFIAYKGTFFIFELIETGQKSPSMGVPMFIPYIVVPLGSIFMLIRLAQQFKRVFMGDLLDQEIEGVE